MYKAICDSCGRACEVPFRPSGDKPVYCSDCFEKNRERSEPRRFEGRNFRRPRFENKDSRPPQNNEQYNTLNAKLDKILTILTPSPLPPEKKPPKKAVLPPKA